MSILELSIFGSSFTFGLTIGSIICGFLADKMGRKSILIIATVFQVFYFYYKGCSRFSYSIFLKHNSNDFTKTYVWNSHRYESSY